jgi:hypothetical protein
MEKVTIISTANSVEINFNAYYPNTVDINKACYNKNKIIEVALYNDYVLLKILGEDDKWKLSFNNNKYYNVDKVNNETTASLSDLYDKVSELIKI